MGEAQAIWNVNNPVDGSGKKIDTSAGTKLAGAAAKYTTTTGKANMVGDKTVGYSKVQKAMYGVNNPVDGSGKVIGQTDGTDLDGNAKKLTVIKGRANVVGGLKEGQPIGEVGRGKQVTQ